jgi:hypothetical protein
MNLKCSPKRIKLGKDASPTPKPTRNLPKIIVHRCGAIAMNIL